MKLAERIYWTVLLLCPITSGIAVACAIISRSETAGYVSVWALLFMFPVAAVGMLYSIWSMP